MEGTSLKYFRRVGQLIYAPATALGGPVVSVRISGSDLSPLTEFMGAFPAPGTFSLKSIKNPYSGELLDRSLVLFFKGPNSFTGEDVLEIQMHGVPALVDELFSLLEKKGIQLALPGEFSFRAVQNDRMTLLEAEALQQAFAVDGLESAVASKLLGLSSDSEKSLNELIDRASGLLAKARGRIEAGIDFSEAEQEQAEELRSAGEYVANARQALIHLISSHENFAQSRGEKRVAILGAPNVGKSTLFNILCGVERALVSPQAGTTRDVIDVRIKGPKGIQYRIFDTAGIHDSFENEIEEKGIERGLDWAKRADLIIHVAKFGSEGALPSKKISRKADLQIFSFSPESKNLEGKEDTLFVDLLKDAPKIHRWVLDSLDRKSTQRAAESSAEEKSALSSDRQIRMIRASFAEMSFAEQSLMGARPLELAGDHLKKAEEFLQGVLGRGLNNEYIGEIFSQFCLGK